MRYAMPRSLLLDVAIPWLLLRPSASHLLGFAPFPHIVGAYWRKCGENGRNRRKCARTCGDPCQKRHTWLDLCQKITRLARNRASAGSRCATWRGIAQLRAAATRSRRLRLAMGRFGQGSAGFIALVFQGFTIAA